MRVQLPSFAQSVVVVAAADASGRVQRPLNSMTRLSKTLSPPHSSTKYVESAEGLFNRLLTGAVSVPVLSRSSGGMADTAGSEPAAFDGVGVQVPS